jgi:hypothetical protein
LVPRRRLVEAQTPTGVLEPEFARRNPWGEHSHPTTRHLDESRPTPFGGVLPTT